MSFPVVAARDRKWRVASDNTAVKSMAHRLVPVFKFQMTELGREIVLAGKCPGGYVRGGDVIVQGHVLHLRRDVGQLVDVAHMTSPAARPITLSIRHSVSDVHPLSL